MTLRKSLPFSGLRLTALRVELGISNGKTSLHDPERCLPRCRSVEQPRKFRPPARTCPVLGSSYPYPPFPAEVNPHPTFRSVFGGEEGAASRRLLHSGSEGAAPGSVFFIKICTAEGCPGPLAATASAGRASGRPPTLLRLLPGTPALEAPSGREEPQPRGERSRPRRRHPARPTPARRLVSVLT